MDINLSERMRECMETINNAKSEINDYANIALCINALREVSIDDGYTYTQEEFNDVVGKLQRLCAKHEIVLPDYVEWGSLNIV